ncbi:MAG: DUF2156 domain-containing protein [Deltaproteobacteria bacterium]|nr:DUF2156 domain-containing protein [Deltaproteobacteria bacterium]
MSELAMEMRPFLHPLFKDLRGGISEFTFANIYLFRSAHSYMITRLKHGLLMIAGTDKGERFFMLPWGLPEKDVLGRLFKDFKFMKNASEAQAEELKKAGYSVVEDRDNFDYLYSREEMTRLQGRKFHKKKNLVNAFLGNHLCRGLPLQGEYMDGTLAVLDEWRRTSPVEGDYTAAREAILEMRGLQLCGGIYYIEGKPVAYVLGEELSSDTFVVHFEKGVEGYKGLMQFVNQSFSSILPDTYAFINREQDLGDEGLRQAKESYRPSGFVEKYMVRAAR